MKKTMGIAIVMTLLLAVAGINTSWSGGSVSAQFATVPSRTPVCAPQLVLRALSAPPDGLVVSLWTGDDSTRVDSPQGSLIDEKPFLGVAVAFAVSDGGFYRVWGWTESAGWQYLIDHTQTGCDSVELVILQPGPTLMPVAPPTHSVVSLPPAVTPTAEATRMLEPSAVPSVAMLVPATPAPATLTPSVRPSLAAVSAITMQPSETPMAVESTSAATGRSSWPWLVGIALVVAVGVFVITGFRRRT